MTNYWANQIARLAAIVAKNSISSIVIGLKKLLFSTYSLAKLLSDSLLVDSTPITFKVVV